MSDIPGFHEKLTSSERTSTGRGQQKGLAMWEGGGEQQ